MGHGSVLRALPRTVRGLATVALLAGAAASRAQVGPATPGVPGAEATVRAYAEAFAGGDWTGAVRLMDPSEVDEFVGLLRRMETAGLDDRDAVVAGMSPSEKVEAMKASRNRPSGGGIPGLDAEDSAEALAAFFEALMSAQPVMGDAMASLDVDLIGTVLESDTLAHVVGRFGFAMLGTQMGGVQVTSARWTDGRWVVAFDERLNGFRRMFEAFAAPTAVEEADG